MTLLARPSSSASGGGVGSFWGFTRRQVMRVGAAHVRGGTTTLRPLCRLPRMEPPRASTMKLTRNLGHSGSVSASPRRAGERGQGRQPLPGHSPRVHRAGYRADVVRGLCGRAAGDQRVFIILFGHLGTGRGKGQLLSPTVPGDTASGPGQWTSRRGQGGSASHQEPSEGGATQNSLTLWDKARPESKREHRPPGTYTASPRLKTLGQASDTGASPPSRSSLSLSLRATCTSGLPPAPPAP